MFGRLKRVRTFGQNYRIGLADPKTIKRVIHKTQDPATGLTVYVSK